jgi:hypothetical protein
MTATDRKPARALALYTGRDRVGTIRMTRGGKFEAISAGNRLRKSIGTFPNARAAADALKATQPASVEMIAEVSTV